MYHVPLYHHPTTIVIIDDDRSYIKQFLMSQNLDNFNIVAFDNISHALNFINSQMNDTLNIRNYFSDSLHIKEKYEQWSIDLNLYEIPKKIFDQNRFNQISTIICDYSMPMQNGIEFFKNIKNPFITKILLTGVAQNSLAVKAFNSGLINYFIKKEQIDLDKKLEEICQKAQQDYFSKISYTGIDVIIKNMQKSSALYDYEFSEFFSSILTKYKIREYYIFESFGCYFMINNDNEIYLFFIYTEADAINIFSGNYCDDEEAIKIFNQNPKIITYFTFGTPDFPEDEGMEKFLTKATKFKGTYNNFYWTIKKYKLGDLYEKFAKYERFVKYEENI